MDRFESSGRPKEVFITADIDEYRHFNETIRKLKRERHKMDRIIVVTGARTGVDTEIVFERLTRFLMDTYSDKVLVIHGGQRGVDSIAQRWCETIGVRFISIPALFETRGKKDGHDRNRFMLITALALQKHYQLTNEFISVEGFPGPQSIGTYNCLVQAYDMGIPAHMLRPGESEWVKYEPKKVKQTDD